MRKAIASARAKKVAGNERLVIVKACSKCGCTELASPSLGSYSPETILIPGINEMTGVKECLKCGYCGYPVEKIKTIRFEQHAKVRVHEMPKESLFKRLKRKLFKR